MDEHLKLEKLTELVRRELGDALDADPYEDYDLDVATERILAAVRYGIIHAATILGDV